MSHVQRRARQWEEKDKRDTINLENPTVCFTISEPQNQEIREFYEVQERSSMTDFEATTLCKGR